MNDEVRQEPIPIEAYYQNLAKKLVDTLFDLGLLSQSLSRDGIEGIEGLVALHFQQIGDSASRCAGFSKKYKVLGGRLAKDENDTRERHEEEMAWIKKAKEADAEVGRLERKLELVEPWGQDVVKFLKAVSEIKVKPPYQEASRAAYLLQLAFEIGVAEPDLGPGEIQEGKPFQVDFGKEAPAHQEVADLLKKPMKHEARHFLLHRCLDELYADYLLNHPEEKDFMKMPLARLIKWSCRQSEGPDHPGPGEVPEPTPEHPAWRSGAPQEICGDRHEEGDCPATIWLCTLKPGHRGDHRNGEKVWEKS